MLLDRIRWRALGVLMLWTLLGAVIIAAFFLAAFFSDYSPLLAVDAGAVILLVPLLTGLLLGILLTDEEIVVAAGAGLLAATFAVALIGLFLFSPQIVGATASTRATQAFSISRTALSAIMLFPLVVVGSVLGRGVGDFFLPSARTREEIAKLREETRRWHEALERMEKRPRDWEAVPPSETPPKEEGKG